MKIVVQQGQHINREDVEAFLRITPKSWIKAIDGITVYSSLEMPFKIEYYSKNKILGIHISKDYKGDLSESLDKIAIALQTINEFGHLPNRIPKSRTDGYLENWIQEKHE